MKIAVVGASGMVGQVMLKVLEERNLPITELIPVASERSVGKMVHFKGKEYPIVSMDTAISKKPPNNMLPDLQKQVAPLSTILRHGEWNPIFPWSYRKLMPISSPKKTKSLLTPTALPFNW